MSNQYQNDPQPIPQILWNTFHQRKCFFVIFVYNYPVSQLPPDRAPIRCTFVVLCRMLSINRVLLFYLDKFI